MEIENFDYEKSPEFLAALQESLEQVARGETIPSDVVRAEHMAKIEAARTKEAVSN